jgi:hypothetical protein
MRALGRNEPADFEHVAAHPASEVLAKLTQPTPVVPGTPWYTSFDTPVLGGDGKFRVSITPGATVRGGHCYCLEPAGEPDPVRAWFFYNQGELPACEGFGNSRAMSLLHAGELFAAPWLYDDARRVEGTFPSGEGSTNQAAAEALKRWGDHPAADVYKPLPQEIPDTDPIWEKGIPGVSIVSFHWATTVEEIRQALGYPASVSEFPFLNSWGSMDYPHRVYMSDETINELLTQGSEYTILVPA